MHAPICMKHKTNDSMIENKKLYNYVCYTKYAPLLRNLTSNFKIAPISMKQKPNDSLSDIKKLFNYMCYAKYAPLLRNLTSNFKMD